MRRPNAKRFRYSQKCSHGDRSARLDLLPVSGRITKTNHVFLRIAVTLAEFFNSNAQGTKELSLISHPLYLEKRMSDGHEQNSWAKRHHPAPQKSNGSSGYDVSFSAVANRR